jgi:3-oxoacyl-[acyl-carrier-protein] synthase II
MNDTVITGCGAVTPFGVGAETLHRRWSAGECAIVEGEGRCAAFDPTEHLSVKETRRTDRFTQLAIAAGDEALAQAGWARDSLPYPSERIACVIATGIGGVETMETQFNVLRDKGRERVSPLAVPLMMGNAAAATIAIRYGLRGESFGLVSACAAGTQAIGTALRMMRGREFDAVVVGGTESALSELSTVAFARMGATSVCGISRPFDRRRDGFVIGEGAAVMVLEHRVGAQARGATVLGTLLGYGASSDAHHLTAPESDGFGPQLALRAALEDAELTSEEVDYVNLHGTSTPLNDRMETHVMKSVFGERAHAIPMSSLKSAIGHLLGGAGAVELVATLMALRHRVAPPTLNYEEPDEGLDLDYVTTGARALNGSADTHQPLVGLSNGFGFGGHNAVLAVRGA